MEFDDENQVVGLSSFALSSYVNKIEFSIIILCSQQFSESNFGLTSYIDKSNRESKMYEISRDGFAFLVMGYTGAKAAQFKEAPPL